MSILESEIKLAMNQVKTEFPEIHQNIYLRAFQLGVKPEHYVQAVLVQAIRNGKLVKCIRNMQNVLPG